MPIFFRRDVISRSLSPMNDKSLEMSSSFALPSISVSLPSMDGLKSMIPSMDGMKSMMSSMEGMKPSISLDGLKSMMSSMEGMKPSMSMDGLKSMMSSMEGMKPSMSMDGLKSMMSMEGMKPSMSMDGLKSSLTSMMSMMGSKFGGMGGMSLKMPSMSSGKCCKSKGYGGGGGGGYGGGMGMSSVMPGLGDKSVEREVKKYVDDKTLAMLLYKAMSSSKPKKRQNKKGMTEG